MNRNSDAIGRPAARLKPTTAGLAALRLPPCRPAANDNVPAGGHDHLLREALRHFANHGLGAAETARAAAEAAFFAGDRQRYQHWLGVCRALDRRMAALLPDRLDQPAPGAHGRP